MTLHSPSPFSSFVFDYTTVVYKLCDIAERCFTSAFSLDIAGSEWHKTGYVILLFPTDGTRLIRDGSTTPFGCGAICTEVFENLYLTIINLPFHFFLVFVITPDFLYSEGWTRIETKCLRRKLCANYWRNANARSRYPSIPASRIVLPFALFSQVFISFHSFQKCDELLKRER